MKYLLIFLFVAVSVIACNSAEPGKDAPETPGQTATEIPVALQTLMQSVEQHPDSTGLRLQLAAGLDSIGRYREALQQMDSLLVKDSTNYGLWFTNAKIAEDAGDTLLAMQSYDNALRIYPSAEAMLSLANLYAEQKNERALLICATVKKMRLGREIDAHCAFISGIYNARTGNRDKALAFFDECIGNNYTYMEAYIEKGLVYFDNGAYRDALNVFSFASTVNAVNPDPYYWQGRCYEMMQIKDSAILRMKQSLSLNTKDPATKAALERLGE